MLDPIPGTFSNPIRAKLSRLEMKIQADAPKIKVYENFVAAENSVPVEVFAKRMASIGVNIGRNRCFRWMREQEIIEKKRPLPYQEFLDAGYFTIRETVQTLPDGRTRIHPQTLITPKGQIWLAGRLQRTY